MFSQSYIGHWRSLYIVKSKKQRNQPNTELPLNGSFFFRQTSIKRQSSWFRHVKRSLVVPFNFLLDKIDISLRRCLSSGRVTSIARHFYLFKHFSFVILLFHFLMISLLLLDVGLSCFVCLVQVITDCARAAEGKFFLSFHPSSPSHPPSPPPPSFFILYCPRYLIFASYTNSLLLVIRSFPLPRKIKSIDCPCCVWFHWMCCE